MVNCYRDGDVAGRFPFPGTNNYRLAVLPFFAGSGKGNFLEYWAKRVNAEFYALQKPQPFTLLMFGLVGDHLRVIKQYDITQRNYSCPFIGRL